MNRQRASILLASVVAFGALQGCHCPPKHRAGYPPPPRAVVAPPPIVPGPQPFNPAAPPVVPGPPSAAPAVPPVPGGFQPNGFLTPAPPNPSAPSNPPAPPAPGSVTPSVFLEAPQPAGPEGAGGEPARPMPSAPPPPDTTRQYSPQTPEPPSAKGDRSATPVLPVDIPQFAVARSNVASGQEPYPEGVAWLKARGYRTVLHVRSPGEDDREARRRFEQSGLRFLILEVSPQTLTKEVVDQFNRLVGDTNNQPLFVYDRDGSMAGGLWYLHYRLVEKESDERAREDAARLGFRENEDGPHKGMWLAVQNFLDTMKRQGEGR